MNLGRASLLTNVSNISTSTKGRRKKTK